MANAKTADKHMPVKGMDFDGEIHDDATTTVIAKVSDAFGTVTTFADMMADVDSGNVVHISEVDDVVRLDSEDKGKLIGVPIILVSWQFKYDKVQEREYVSMAIVTDKNEKFIVTDGSTGIYEQLARYTSKLGKVVPIFLPKGLTKSDYVTTDNEGKTIQATTFYLSNES
jgi:hypothetical protein